MRRIAMMALGLVAGAAMAQTAAAQSAMGPKAPMTAPAAPMTAPAAPPVQLKGKITAMDGMKITVTAADGSTKTAMLSPDYKVYRLKKIDMSAIAPGSFIATTNVPMADGVGQSTEFRVFSPDMKGLGEGNYSMQDGTSNMMTNATVTNQVVKTPKGREMDVAYDASADKGGKGVRHIVVPDDVVIRSMSSAGHDDIKVGIAIEARSVPGPDGVLVVRRLLIGENGQPPVT